jgi:hypothetical protein
MSGSSSTIRMSVGLILPPTLYPGKPDRDRKEITTRPFDILQVYFITGELYPDRSWSAPVAEGVISAALVIALLARPSNPE